MFYIQLIGLLAFCVLILSFYKKTNTQILTYQITANFAYAVHYFLLGGISGALSSIVGMIRNMVFINKNINKKIVVPIFIILYLIISIIFYDKSYSILPMFGNSFYLLSMVKGDKKALLMGAIINSSFWLLYSVFMLSYVCLVTESILIISNSIQLNKYYKKRLN